MTANTTAAIACGISAGREGGAPFPKSPGGPPETPFSPCIIGASVERRLVGILVAAALSTVFLTAPVRAGTAAVQATDPSANSPAGTVYSIPLDSARQDAAPHGHGGSGSHSGSGGSGGGSAGGGSAGGGGGSAGGGSAGGTGASGTTGATGTSGAGGTSNATAGRSSATHGNGHAGRSAPVLVPGGQPGSLVHSSNGFGSSSQVPSLDRSPTAGLGSLQSNASSAPVLAIILALVVLGVGGYVGGRAWRSSGGRGPTPPAAPAGPAPAGPASLE